MISMATATTTTTTIQRPTPVVYHIPPTKLIPNSKLPLLYFPNFFKPSSSSQPSQAVDAGMVYDHFLSHGWETQWIAKYGLSQPSHYHPETHECMAVLTGPGRIRFGVADLDADWRKNTPLSLKASQESKDEREQRRPSTTEIDTGATDWRKREDQSEGEGVYYEPGGLELAVNAGDAFIIPAGVAHKSYNPAETAEEAVALTGGSFHGVTGDSDDTRKVVAECELSGFTMIGAYPGSRDWTWAEGGAHVGDFEKVWAVSRPELDPLVGKEGGLNVLW